MSAGSWSQQCGVQRCASFAPNNLTRQKPRIGGARCSGGTRGHWCHYTASLPRSVITAQDEIAKEPSAVLAKCFQLRLLKPEGGLSSTPGLNSPPHLHQLACACHQIIERALSAEISDLAVGYSGRGAQAAEQQQQQAIGRYAERALCPPMEPPCPHRSAAIPATSRVLGGEPDTPGR